MKLDKNMLLDDQCEKIKAGSVLRNQQQREVDSLFVGTT
jgi:hypothetical protein